MRKTGEKRLLILTTLFFAMEALFIYFEYLRDLLLIFHDFVHNVLFSSSKMIP
jgi:hypothetical protein